MSRIDAKIVLLGKSYAGKTCLVNRYCHASFDSNLPYQNFIMAASTLIHAFPEFLSPVHTIGAAFGSKRETIGKKSIMLGIWDTAGHERYESMTRMYYRGAAASILCYDITDKTSFDRVRFWAGELKATEPDCKIYLVGTKKDIADDDTEKREVTKAMAKPLAEDFHTDLYETSAKTGENIDELFKKIATDLIEQKEKQTQEYKDQVSETLHLNNSSSWRQKGCSFLRCST